jgi:hypothetical protein
VNEIGRAILEDFPEPNLSLFLWLIDLMAKVVLKADVNRMNAHNMAIVISPNLFSLSVDANPMESLLVSQKVCQFTTSALRWRMATEHNVFIEVTKATAMKIPK